jgi:transposase-like protein
MADWSSPVFVDTVICPWFGGVGFLESSVSPEDPDAPQVPVRSSSQVIELARSGARVAQLASTFGMSEAAIYLWLEQEKVDRGEIEGQSTDQALELAAARQRIRQLETELAVSRKVNEVFLTQPVSTSSAVRDSTPALHREAACLSL